MQGKVVINIPLNGSVIKVVVFHVSGCMLQFGAVPKTFGRLYCKQRLRFLHSGSEEKRVAVVKQEFSHSKTQASF
jgi:hypothetical protein